MLVLAADLTGVVPAAPTTISDKLQFFSVMGSSLAQCPFNQSNLFAYNASCFPTFIQAYPSMLVPSQLGMQCPAIAFNRSASSNNILLQVCLSSECLRSSLALHDCHWSIATSFAL